MNVKSFSSKKLLPDICQLTEFYVFKHDSAPANRTRETDDPLTRETLEFILPPFCRQTVEPAYSSPVDYKVWSVMPKVLGSKTSTN